MRNVLTQLVRGGPGIEIDPDYANRTGYDASFLPEEVPLPALTEEQAAQAAVNTQATEEPRYLLPYHHFTVVLNKERRLALFTAVNIDGALSREPRRARDHWYFDPRVARDEQTGKDVYDGNDLDLGHLVRRLDPAWGDTEGVAKLANDDTFHFTNCSPQHEITNQGKVREAPPGLKLWGKLEDHVATQGKKDGRKLCVFNGPVFRTTDRVYRGVQIPKEFWKLVVYENDAGNPASVAFVLTQAALIQDLEEEFQVGEYKAVQVRVKDLEAKTNLDFGQFRNWDVLEQEGSEESFTRGVPAVVLSSLADVVL